MLSILCRGGAVMLTRFCFLLLLLPALSSAQPVRLCLIGNSITAGFAPSTRGWSVDIAVLNAGLDFGVKSVAHSGDKVAAARLLFDSEIVGKGCTHVAFLIGTNDLPDGTPAATIYAGIDAMADAVEAQGGVSILCSNLPRSTGPSFSVAMESRRTSLNAMLAARGGSIFVDTSAAVAGTCAPSPFALAWAGSTSYLLDNVRVNGGVAYVVTTAGTSAGAGGPTGTGTGIVDGTVVWSSAPCISSAAGGATDGLHPNNAGQLLQAQAVQAAVQAAGGWHP